MSGTAELVVIRPEPKIDETQDVELPSTDSDLTAEPPPDGGYGWVCVASVFIINGFTWGVTAVSHYRTLITIYSNGMAWNRRGTVLSLTSCKISSHMAST